MNPAMSTMRLELGMSWITQRVRSRLTRIWLMRPATGMFMAATVVLPALRGAALLGAALLLRLTLVTVCWRPLPLLATLAALAPLEEDWPDDLDAGLQALDDIKL